jgi:aminoglycoside phosphotransferase (APT) family kinase protein
MTDFIENDKFARLAQRLEPHGTLLRAWPLKGGVSAQVTAVELALPDGHTRKVVVRQHGDIDRLHNPEIAATEYQLLQILQTAGIPAPAPYYLDQSGTIFALPYVVLDYIEGAPDFSPADLSHYLRDLAAHLAQIHQVAGAAHDLSFLPRQAQRHAAMLLTRPPGLDDSLREGSVRDALESVPTPSPRESVPLHGDYWPGNILWRGGHIVGIID